MGAPAEFAILRVEKRKTLGAVASLAGHALRDRPTPNADPARTPDNRVLAGAGLADGFHGGRKRLRAASPSRVLCYESELLHAVHHLLTGDPSLVRVSPLEVIMRHLAHSCQAEAS